MRTGIDLHIDNLHNYASTFNTNTRSLVQALIAVLIWTTATDNASNRFHEVGLDLISIFVVITITEVQ